MSTVLDIMVSMLAGLGLVTLLVITYILWRCAMDLYTLIYGMFKAILAKTTFDEFTNRFGEQIAADIEEWVAG